MEKKKNQFFDTLETILKIITPIGAIIAFLIGIYHYRDSQAEEFKKIYWEKRFMVYEEISSLTAQLANSFDTTRFNSLSHQFWSIHFGKSVLVADKHVATAMQSFGESLQRAVYPDSMVMLQSKALAVSHACRISLQETWEPVPVKEIKTMEN